MRVWRTKEDMHYHLGSNSLVYWFGSTQTLIYPNGWLTTPGYEAWL